MITSESGTRGARVLPRVRVRVGPTIATLLFLAVALLLVSPPSRLQAATSIARVQTGAFRETYAASVTLTLPAASTPDTLLVATLSSNGGSAFTAPAGWVSAASRSDGNTTAAVWYYPSQPGGITSVTFSAAGSVATAGVLTEWSGVAPATPLDGSGTSTASGASITTTTTGAVSGDLAIAAFGIQRTGGGAITTTPMAGWTALPRDATTDWFHFDGAYVLGAPAGVLTQTESASAAVAWTAALATFRGTGSSTTPDFQLTASPATTSVATSSGGSGTYVATLTAVNGYSSAVNLTVGASPSLPPGVTTSFAPSSVTPTAGGVTSTLTVTVPAGTAAGTHQLTITGVGAGAPPHTSTVTLVLTGATTGNPIVLENQQAGSSAWQLYQGAFRVANDQQKQVKGFASLTSVRAGQSITFFVTVNPVQTVNIDVYRMGWYGGAGGRLMQHIGPLPGTSQPACPIASGTGLTACPWAPTHTLNVPTSWTSGVYLALLTNAQGFQNYITFVVRDDRAAPLLYKQAVNTYQAYNNYPSDGSGKSFYHAGRTSAAATKVSFDRPYAADGVGLFLDFELQFLQWLERSGYDVTYSTDVDAHADGAGLLRNRGVLSVGHDEYWSKQMFDAAEAARDAGVGLGFFGANAVYWQVRYESSGGGVPNRVLVCYKTASADPVQGPTTTTNFRAPPVNRPEQQLIGIQFSSAGFYANTPAPYVVSNASSWVFAGTGVSNGTSIPGIVGYEVDRYFPGTPLPPNKSWAILSQSPFVDTSGATDTGQSSIYQAPSNAWVFAAGTIRWGRGLDAVTGDPRIQRITKNVLDAFIGSTPPPPPPPTADFAVSVSPSSRSVAAASGGIAAYTTSLTASGGYTGAVNLTVTSSPALPVGVTTAFAPPSVTLGAAGASSTLTATVPPGAAPGTYQLTITASGAGGLTRTAPATLVVTGGGGGGPITRVQTGAFRETYGPTVAPTLPAPSTAGTLLVATLASNASTAFSAPAGWVQAASRTDGNTRAEVWYYPANPGGIAGATFTASGSGATAGVLTEWSGVATTSPLETSGTSTAGNATAVTTTTSGAASGGLAIVAFGIQRSGGGAITATPSSGWSALPRDATTDWFHFAAAYRIGAPAGVATETETSSAPVAWTTALATFRAAP